MGYDLKLETEYEKGCILNSRILWFFSNAYLTLRDEALLENAKHAYRFLRDCCLDREQGGVYWSVTYDGKPKDETKHTYNQAFAIYALSSYYDASQDQEALQIAFDLQDVVEEKCTDEYGYLEAFDRYFRLASNEKLSENGVMAEKTMNTLLHVFEAYTELYRVMRHGSAANREAIPQPQRGLPSSDGIHAPGKGYSSPEGIHVLGEGHSSPDGIYVLGEGHPSPDGISASHTGYSPAGGKGRLHYTEKRLEFMLDLFTQKVYNPVKGRQEVFFDRTWNSLIDLYSYGHDIETSWLLDRGLAELDHPLYTQQIAPITAEIAENIYNRAYVDHSVLNEAENGVDDTKRVWWIQAEAIVGFLNAWEKKTRALQQNQADGKPSSQESFASGADAEKYLEAAMNIWDYICSWFVDPREGSEWFENVRADHTPMELPIVQPWKCPYHNGRMCMEVIRRLGAGV